VGIAIELGMEERAQTEPNYLFMCQYKMLHLRTTILSALKNTHY